MSTTSDVLLVIRGGVLNGLYQSGEQLKAARIASELNTSGTVVREVFAQLTAEGLLRRVPNRGFFVQKFDLQELGDLTELRCQVETTAALLAVERGDVQWEAGLIAAYHELSRTPRRTKTTVGPFEDAWAVAHKAFHRKLLAGCGSDHFLRISSNLADHADLYRRWSAQVRGDSDRAPEAEHRDLLSAAIARDGKLLARRLRAHYELTAELVRDGFLAREVD